MPVTGYWYDDPALETLCALPSAPDWETLRQYPPWWDLLYTWAYQERDHSPVAADVAFLLATEYTAAQFPHDALGFLHQLEEVFPTRDRTGNDGQTLLVAAAHETFPDWNPPWQSLDGENLTRELKAALETSPENSGRLLEAVTQQCWAKFADATPLEYFFADCRQWHATRTPTAGLAPTPVADATPVDAAAGLATEHATDDNSENGTEYGENHSADATILAGLTEKLAAVQTPGAAEKAQVIAGNPELLAQLRSMLREREAAQETTQEIA